MYSHQVEWTHLAADINDGERDGRLAVRWQRRNAPALLCLFISAHLWLYCAVMFWSMFGSEKNREHERFYLLPGMGGSALRRKRRLFFWWSIATGLVASVILAGVLYWIARR